MILKYKTRFSNDVWTDCKINPVVCWRYEQQPLLLRITQNSTERQKLNVEQIRDMTSMLDFMPELDHEYMRFELWAAVKIP